jgi:hypothetical protein
MKNIQILFDLVPHCLKHVWCYCSHSIPCVGFQVLKVIDLNLVDNVLHITPQDNIQWVLNLVTWEAKRLIHLCLFISLSRWFLTWWQKWGGTSSCWRMVWGGNWGSWFLTWWQKLGGTSSCWRIVWGGNWGSVYSCSVSKYERLVTVFSEKKNGPINLSCIKLAYTFTLGLPLSNSHVTCWFWLLQIF